MNSIVSPSLCLFTLSINWVRFSWPGPSKKKREKRKQNENKSVRTKEEEEIEEEDTNKNLGKKGESYRFTQSNSLEGPVGGRESCSLHLQKNTLYIPFKDY